MKRLNMSKKAVLVEGIIILAGLVYVVLQVIYGVRYHISPIKYVGNILVVLAVYAIETYLYFEPWRIHRIPPEACTGRLKKYCMHMAQGIKLIFNVGLLIPCVCDILEKELKESFSAVFILSLVVFAVYYEYRIFMEMRGK